MSESSVCYSESYAVLERSERDARYLIEHVRPVTATNERLALAHRARQVIRYLDFLADRLELFDV